MSLKIKNVIVTKYNIDPPKESLLLNDVLYDEWLNIETKERRKWNGKKWISIWNPSDTKTA